MNISSLGNSIRFGSIYANYNSDNTPKYNAALKANPQEHELRPYATRIFRELSSQSAISKLLKNYRTTDVQILGSSDGSEAWAYAIKLSEAFKGPRAQNLKIAAVEKQPFLDEIAKTGHIVCTEQEKIWSNDSRRSKENPLRGEGWGKYLKQSSAPQNFGELCERYPVLSQITSDKVAGISIGNGMEWYEIDKTGLPEIDFLCGDMRDHLEPKTDAQQKVFVLANSVGYIVEESSKKFLDVFEKIQNNNCKQGDTYVVLGDVELNIFRQVPELKSTIEKLGFSQLSPQEYRSAGIKDFDDVQGKIYKLRGNMPVKLHYR